MASTPHQVIARPAVRRSHRGWPWVFLSGVAILPFLLTAAEPPPPTPVITAPPVERSAEAESSEADKKAELEFLHSLENSLNKGDGTAFDKSIDTAALIRQAVKGLNLNSTGLAKVTTEFTKTFTPGAELAVDMQANQGGYKLLQVRTIAKERRALFRMILEGGGINFHDVVLTKNNLNQYCIVDIYVFANGEMLSATLRRHLAPWAAQDNPEILKLLSPAEKAMIKHGKEFESMLRLQSEKKFSEAFKIFQGFPVEMREDKNVLIFGIQISWHINPDENNTLIKTYARLFPDDPALPLLNIDLFFTQNQYDKVLESLDVLERRVGKDAMLLTYRAQCLLIADKFDEAAQAAQQAIDLEKSLIHPYFPQMVAAIKLKRWDTVFSTLAQFEKEFGRPYGDITNNASFQEFLASPQGKKWQADHAPAPQNSAPAP